MNSWGGDAEVPTPMPASNSPVTESWEFCQSRTTIGTQSMLTSSPITARNCLSLYADGGAAILIVCAIDVASALLKEARTAIAVTPPTSAIELPCAANSGPRLNELKVRCAVNKEQPCTLSRASAGDVELSKHHHASTRSPPPAHGAAEGVFQSLGPSALGLGGIRDQGLGSKAPRNASWTHLAPGLSDRPREQWRESQI